MWEIIKEYPNYSISNKGEIKNNRTGNIKSQRLDRYGYPRVTLYNKDQSDTYTIHSLVAKYFCIRLDHHTQVNHKDGDKTNNDYKNLEWCTASHNCKHRDSMYTSKWSGTLNPSSKLNECDVIVIRSGKYTRKELSLMYNVDVECIRRVQKYITWKNVK